MCNLYRLHAGPAAIAQLFAVAVGAIGNQGTEVYPGYPGLVVADGLVTTMNWGFPVVLKGRDGHALKPKPVTNARDDKLDTPFWQASFAARRCLIPVSHWAEPEGPPRAMTRTWYGLPGEDVVTIAGLWRDTPAWGRVYAMVMVDASPAMRDVHDRMPVILDQEDRARWIGADRDAARACVRTWPGDLAVERTRDRWAGGTARQHDLFGSD